MNKKARNPYGRGRRSLFHRHRQHHPGGPDQGLVQVEGLLRRRGYDVFLTRAVSFPVNWVQMMPPPDERGVQAILACGDGEVDNFIRDILAGQKSLHRIGILSWILGRLLAVLFGLFGRRALGKLYIADGSCNGCGLCARACPAGAILMRGGRPRWRINCEDCCRCINICPEKSIQLSVPLLGFHLALQMAVMVWLIPSLLGLIAWPDPVSQGLRILGGVFSAWAGPAAIAAIPPLDSNRLNPGESRRRSSALPSRRYRATGMVQEKANRTCSYCGYEALTSFDRVCSKCKKKLA